MTLEDRYMFYCILSSEIEFQIQRHIAYSKSKIDLYSDYKFKPQHIHYCGLCGLLLKSFDVQVYLKQSFKSIFPELYRLKPKTTGDYWFPTELSGWKRRLKLVNQCIYETELQLHNQNQSS